MRSYTPPFIITGDIPLKNRWLADYNMTCELPELRFDSPPSSSGPARLIKRLVDACNARFRADESSFEPFCKQLINAVHFSTDLLLPKIERPQKQPH